MQRLLEPISSLLHYSLLASKHYCKHWHYTTSSRSFQLVAWSHTLSRQVADDMYLAATITTDPSHPVYVV